MIGSLRGALIERHGQEVLIEVAGVGYRVTVTPSTLAGMGEIGAPAFLYIHDHRREDAQILYGFPTRDERTCFEALIGAHGVGPALALAILSVHQPDALRRVVLDEDIGALCLVPGVGKKTAQRLLVELVPRLGVPDSDVVAGASSPRSASPGGIAAQAPDRLDAVAARADVREALLGLGYGPDEVLAVLRDLPEGTDPSVLLREALQRLALGTRV